MRIHSRLMDSRLIYLPRVEPEWKPSVHVVQACGPLHISGAEEDGAGMMR
jgi:hypothetical protein